MNTSLPFSLGSQPPGNRLTELEPGTHRTHMVVPANRQCHGGTECEMPQEDTQLGLQKCGIRIDSKELPRALCADPCAAQPNCRQLLDSFQCSPSYRMEWADLWLQFAFSSLASFARLQSPHIISLDSQKREEMS